MRAVLVAVAIAACRPAPVQEPRPPIDVVARSHAILEAFDHGDAAAIRPVLAASYVHFEGHVVDRAGELDALAKRTPDSPQIASRAWSNERTFVGPTTATFIGKAREQNGGNKVHGGGFIYEGWYTLGWARDGGDWKLVYLAWKPAETQTESAQWNQIFHNEIGFNHEPNRLLTAAIAGVSPGEALDVATGQGRNALYLARQGWKVTGIDIADEGLRQAREAAAKGKLPLDAINADVHTFDFGRDRWDLVTLIYAPSALARIPDIQRSIRRGGLFVYEYFAPETPADTDAAGPGVLAKQFADGWEIVRDEVVDDVPDWAQDKAKLVRFVARKK
jgi:SAM-dependent methyltransferase